MNGGGRRAHSPSTPIDASAHSSASKAITAIAATRECRYSAAISNPAINRARNPIPTATMMRHNSER